MKTKLLLFLTVFLLLLLTGSVLVRAQAQIVELVCSNVEVLPIDNGNLLVRCTTAGAPATPTATSTPIPTSTPTPVPAGFPWPLRDPNMARDQLPECTYVDPTIWHSLDEVRWDLDGDGSRELVQLGCHFNYTNNADPYDVEQIFGDPVDFLGQQVSYPWETSNELLHKPHFYKYGYRTNLACDPNINYDGVSPVNCVTDFLVQYHGSGNPLDLLTQKHSFYAAGRICEYPGYTECGFIYSGGHANFGLLSVDYKEVRVLRPGGEITVNGVTYHLPAENDADANHDIGQEPYVGASREDRAQFIHDHDPVPTGQQRMSIWSMGQLPGWNEYIGFLFRTRDDWSGVNRDQPYQINFVCPDITQCRYDSSIHSLNSFYAYIPANSTFDPDGDGFADFQGFTDVQGRLDLSCTAASPVCVPLTLQHFPVGRVAFFTDGGNGVNANVDFDTSPPGLFWIQWPN